MPTRKQRRRRDKDFRHDVRVFEVDEEGNEVPIAELRAREEKPKKEKPQARKQTGGRPIREVPQPSWRRAIKRGGLMGGGMLLIFLFVLKSGGLPQRIAIGVFYAVAFIPLTYFVDRTAYRSYEKRMARRSAGGPSKAASKRS
jgi:hypothetical protein